MKRGLKIFLIVFIILLSIVGLGLVAVIPYLSAICLLKDGGVTTFFGNYSLKGAEISIILLPESVNDKNYDTYFGWPEGKCTFKVEDLSYSSLRLEYEGTKSIFRKF